MQPERGPLQNVRVAIVYDCLFPWTGGGGERWYRELAEALVRSGAFVTYLTRQQWPDDDPPQIDGVEVVPVAPFEPLYRSDGRRRMGQPLRYGLGTFRWLRAHRRDFDVVHAANFPFFSLPAVRTALLGSKAIIFVDWHEVWPASFWRSYVGAMSGLIGATVQRLCIALTPNAFVFWRYNAERLRSHGFRREVTILAGLLPAGDSARARFEESDQLIVLFVGRFVGDKGVRLLPDVLEAIRHDFSEAVLVALGEGPERDVIAAEMERRGLAGAVRFPGWVSDDELTEQLAAASCVIVPSIREGYGILAVEATAVGTPIVVAANSENLARHHVTEGVNGFVVEPNPRGIAQGVSMALAGGSKLRKSTRRWYEERAGMMSIQRSTAQVIDRYQRLLSSGGSRSEVSPRA